MATFSQATQPITLNVGGVIYQTSKETISRCHLLTKIVENTTEGEIFIDRDGQHFRHILNFLRNPDYKIPIKAKHEVEFFCLENVKYEKQSKKEKLLASIDDRLRLQNLKEYRHSDIECQKCRKYRFFKDICEKCRACKECCSSTKCGTDICKNCKEIKVDGKCKCDAKLKCPACSALIRNPEKGKCPYCGYSFAPLNYVDGRFEQLHFINTSGPGY